MSNYPPIPQKPSSSRGSSRVSSGGVEREISPRLKKKPHQQISFDHASFLDSLETDEPNSGNQKIQTDVKFLLDQAERLKSEKRSLEERNAHLDQQVHGLHKALKEITSRQQTESESFRQNLKREKDSFDKRVVHLSLRAQDREELLFDWVTAVIELNLHLQHPYLAELMQRTSAVMPAIRSMLKGSTGGRRRKGTGKGSSRKSRSGVNSAAISPRTGTDAMDPEAILAIIHESMNVLDNFKDQKNPTDGLGFDELMRGGGGFKDFLSSNDEGDDDGEDEDDDDDLNGNDGQGVKAERNEALARYRAQTGTAGTGDGDYFGSSDGEPDREDGYHGSPAAHYSTLSEIRKREYAPPERITAEAAMALTATGVVPAAGVVTSDHLLGDGGGGGANRGSTGSTVRDGRKGRGVKGSTNSGTSKSAVKGKGASAAAGSSGKRAGRAGKVGTSGVGKIGRQAPNGVRAKAGAKSGAKSETGARIIADEVGGGGHNNDNDGDESTVTGSIIDFGPGGDTHDDRLGVQRQLQHRGYPGGDIGYESAGDGDQAGERGESDGMSMAALSQLREATRTASYDIDDSVASSGMKYNTAGGGAAGGGGGGEEGGGGGGGGGSTKKHGNYSGDPELEDYLEYHRHHQAQATASASSGQVRGSIAQEVDEDADKDDKEQVRVGQRGAGAGAGKTAQGMPSSSAKYGSSFYNISSSIDDDSSSRQRQGPGKGLHGGVSTSKQRPGSALEEGSMDEVVGIVGAAITADGEGLASAVSSLSGSLYVAGSNDQQQDYAGVGVRSAQAQAGLQSSGRSGRCKSAAAAVDNRESIGTKSPREVGEAKSAREAIKAREERDARDARARVAQRRVGTSEQQIDPDQEVDDDILGLGEQHSPDVILAAATPLEQVQAAAAVAAVLSAEKSSSRSNKRGGAKPQMPQRIRGDDVSVSDSDSASGLVEAGQAAPTSAQRRVSVGALNYESAVKNLEEMVKNPNNTLSVREVTQSYTAMLKNLLDSVSDMSQSYVEAGQQESTGTEAPAAPTAPAALTAPSSAIDTPLKGMSKPTGGVDGESRIEGDASPAVVAAPAAADSRLTSTLSPKPPSRPNSHTSLGSHRSRGSLHPRSPGSPHSPGNLSNRSSRGGSRFETAPEVLEEEVGDLATAVMAGLAAVSTAASIEDEGNDGKGPRGYGRTASSGGTAGGDDDDSITSLERLRRQRPSPRISHGSGFGNSNSNSNSNSNANRRSSSGRQQVSGGRPAVQNDAEDASDEYYDDDFDDESSQRSHHSRHSHHSHHSNHSNHSAATRGSHASSVHSRGSRTPRTKKQQQYQQEQEQQGRTGHERTSQLASGGSEYSFDF